ncbi:zinc-binding dehydrogenase [Kroppenstedtia eburnea]|uniref:Zinc-binding alcohol dehydrogenase/oxidoreductase n=1 Tax=Kroppenstedtia eburnea TaxID=714067 RepID=A0A1N7IRU5_9BACL|nr:zinc-binding dehydrogenase [Kroppenstedtia eburnea]QKI82134.1 zinc-binding dehydrogenase [Kroppenstedtia eburnea]SIS39824.1 zinc-binding alcohol dehydrogenase/oxidoreductase [Kroppenstedtia eburnea]
MKAVVHHAPPGFDGLKVTEMKEAAPGRGEVKIRLKTAGLNHRDLRVLNRPRDTDDPVILGSDGAGIVETVGDGVSGIKEGDEVVINPSLNWPHQSAAPPEEFDILGVPTRGTFAHSTVIPAGNVEPKPEHLTWEEAGVLPLAALTGYRALFSRGGLKAGEHVLIVGIGSGVSTFMLSMAKAAGARVTVTSRSEEKRSRALELGADTAIDSDGDWQEQMKGEKVHLVIDSVGPATFEKSLGRLLPGGRLVTFGETSGPHVEVPLRPFFFGQFTLMGSTMGSSEEFRQMLDLVSAHQIRPVLDRIYPLSEAPAAFLRMKEGKQFGKLGFQIS